MSGADRPRITWVDQARGIGIALVVFGHVIRGLKNGAIIADGPTFRFVDSWIYTFHMPLFFLLSGLFADRQVRQSAGAFARDKFGSIAYPYLVWSILQTLVQIPISRQTNSKLGLRDLARIPIEPIMQFWFLYALLLIAVIYYALRRSGLGPIAVLLGFTAAWATLGRLPLIRWKPLEAARESGLYYALGAVLNRYGWVERIEKAPTSLMAGLLLMGYGAVAAWTARGEPAPLWLSLGLTLCGIAASLALAVLLGRIGGTNFVREMGIDSLEIFVAHTIASAGIRIALQKGFKVLNPTVHILLGTLAGIIFPLILARLCRRYHAEFLFRLPRSGTKTKTPVMAA